MILRIQTLVSLVAAQRTTKYIIALITAIGLTGLTPMIGSMLGGQYELAEEFMKFISLTMGGPIVFLYTFILSIVEMAMYLMKYGVQMMFEGYFWNFVVLRLVCVVDHHIYLLIQYAAWQLSYKHSSITYRWVIRFNGFGFALLMHLGHNEVWGTWIANKIFGLS